MLWENRRGSVLIMGNQSVRKGICMENISDQRRWRYKIDDTVKGEVHAMAKCVEGVFEIG